MAGSRTDGKTQRQRAAEQKARQKAAAAAAEKAKPNYTSKYLSPGRSFGAGMADFGLGFAIDTGLNLMQGKSVATSVGEGLLSGAAFAIAPGLMTAYSLAPLVPMGMQFNQAMNNRMSTSYRNNNTPGTNFTYRDSRSALTMRQAAVQAIQGSKMNARNALGGEAALMHRGYAR